MSAAYHTSKYQRYPKERNLYHNRQDCPAGRRIKPQHRKPGPGKRRQLCALCPIMGRLEAIRDRVEAVARDFGRS